MSRINRSKWMMVSIIVLVSLTIGLFNFTGCEKKPEVYKIGAILPLTGNLAYIGELERNGMTIAANDFNEGRKRDTLEIIIGDSKGDPKEGVAILNKFISVDKIKVFMTTLSSVSRAVQPIAEENKVLEFAMCIILPKNWTTC